MNILILNWKDIKNPDAGGAEIVTYNFAKKLVKEGNAVTLLSRKYNHCSSEETVDGIKIIRLGNKFTVYFKAFLYYQQLNKKPDLVIDMVNTICWQTPLYVPASKRILYVNQLAQEVLFYHLPFPLSTISYLLERIEYLPYKNTKTVCFSQSTKSDLIKFGILSDNIGIFSLGLDHNLYKKGTKKSTDPLFIFVGRLVKMKKPDLCIKAFKRINKQCPKARLSIIGTGPFEKDLRQIIHHHSLDQNVDFITDNDFHCRNNNKIKVKLMQQAWAILVPSVKEGWGMIVTEAAACGTPSIVTDVSGLRDSVINNKTGIILSANPSVEELSNAMIKIIVDNKLRNQLSEEAIKWSKEFDWDKSYRKFKKLIFS